VRRRPARQAPSTPPAAEELHDGGAEAATMEEQRSSRGVDSSFTVVDSSFAAVNSSFSRLATAELSSPVLRPPPLEPAGLCLRGERGCNFAFPLSSIGSLPHRLQPLWEVILAMHSSQREAKILLPSAVGLGLSTATCPHGPREGIGGRWGVVARCIVINHRV
jgi:hypothetical protein